MMNKNWRWMRTLQTVLFTALFSMTTFAGGDHSHDAPTSSGTVQKPRLAASSDAFDLVGVYGATSANTLTLYLDRALTNQAVTNAKIDFESDALKGTAQVQPNGTYLITLPAAALKAKMPFVFTVAAGSESDLLAGELVLANAEAAHDHAWWERIWQWLKDLFGASTADTHEPIKLVSDGVDSPARQSDGSVFLPKSSQRQFGLTHQTVELTESARVQELTGRVIADPAGSSRVQAAQAGRFELAGTNFPTIGQFVKQGQVLGLIRPSVGVIERANQSAQAVDLSSATETARKRLARLEQLEGTVAQKDIDAARIELQSLTERSKGIRASLTTAETLLAPTSGIISAVSVSLGQVVEAKEILFEIVDPKRLRIEAQVAPTLLGDSVKSAQASDGKHSYELRFLGMSRTLQNGTLPMQFAVTGLPVNGLASLAIGQPMQIFVATGERLKGVVLPATAIVKNSKNQNMVWTQHTPELFEPTVVTLTPLNGTQVLVTQELKAGTRVVVQAAGLLNQIR
jgi:RND family efflux transporter MFP subunit